jgi:hypothetical protein
MESMKTGGAWVRMITPRAGKVQVCGALTPALRRKPETLSKHNRDTHKEKGASSSLTP